MTYTQKNPIENHMSNIILRSAAGNRPLFRKKILAYFIMLPEKNIY